MVNHISQGADNIGAFCAGFTSKVEQSANGAEYESQGQARSEAERVAPGYQEHMASRPEGPKYPGNYALSGLEFLIVFTRGDALRFGSRLPLAFIFRAVGAANRIFCDFWGKAFCAHSFTKRGGNVWFTLSRFSVR
jgi:hypothetical protein